VIRVTWDWLGQGPALDLADTVTIEDGAEHDLIAIRHDYERWAEREAAILPGGSKRLLVRARAELLELREVVRRLLAALTEGERPSASLVQALNQGSRRAPQWMELDEKNLMRHERGSGSEVDELLAFYARSAMELIADDAERLRRCLAPSCGMFYLSTRPAQRWCSTQCGSRARVARHYRQHRVRA
jgi:predicted RNA-binding Zn ribbon-like protein